MLPGWFQFDPGDFSYSFLSVLLEGVPFLLLGTLISGALDQFLPSGAMARLLPRNGYLGAAVAAALGLVFPMCECGVVPVVRRLIAKGLPVSFAVAYMLAAPVVNPLVAASTYAAFRGQDPAGFVSVRLGLGWLVAALAGMAVLNLPQSSVLRHGVLAQALDPRAGGPGASPAPGLPARFLRALQTGLRDFLDILFYFIFGVVVASVFGTAVEQSVVLPLALDEWAAASAMMALAFLLSLCSTSDAFVAATFVLFPASAKMAFLVFGPAFDIKLLFLYRALFTKRFIAGLGLGLFVLVGLLSVRACAVFLTDF